MPINTPTGYLDITNATLRGSKIVTTGFVGIANANPTNHLSIGSNLHINDTHSNVLQISGNINAASVVLGGISIAPTFDLEIVTNTGNTTPNTQLNLITRPRHLLRRRMRPSVIRSRQVSSWGMARVSQRFNPQM